MTKIVLDTNIVVSAALSPKGNPAKIISHIAEDEELQMCYNADILAEYKKVLAYERLGIPIAAQEGIISKTQQIGTIVEPTTSTEPMPDESDRIFYDTAKASGAVLVTGNMKHFPNEPFIITPSDFLTNIGE